MRRRAHTLSCPGLQVEPELRLARLAAAGDRQAVEQLVARFQDRLYALAYNYCHDRHRAEDLTQEVWIRVLRGLTGFRGDSQLSTWIYRVAVNTLRNHRPRAVERGAGSDIDGGPACTGKAEGPSGWPPAHTAPDPGVALDVRAALSRLPDEFRRVVALRFGCDLSYQEIAACLGIPLGTVQSRLKRGLERLSRHLKGDTP